MSAMNGSRFVVGAAAMIMMSGAALGQATKGNSPGGANGPPQIAQNKAKSPNSPNPSYPTYYDAGNKYGHCKHPSHSPGFEKGKGHAEDNHPHRHDCPASP